MILTFFFLLGDGTFSFEEFVQVMANMGGISEQSAEDEEEELRQAFRVFQLFGFCVYICSSAPFIETRAICIPTTYSQ